jgi:mercuric ion transport protein
MKMNNSKPFLLGSLVASALASACCIGPIIFAFLGISSIGFLTVFDEYRSLVSLIALSFLGIGFYLTYMKKPSKMCTVENNCSKPNTDKWSKRILWIVTVLTIALLTFPNWSIFLFN